MKCSKILGETYGKLQSHIQNSVKYLRWKTVNYFRKKSSFLDIWQGFEYGSVLVTVNVTWGSFKNYVTQNFWTVTRFNPLIRTYAFRSFALRNFWINSWPIHHHNLCRKKDWVYTGCMFFWPQKVSRGLIETFNPVNIYLFKVNRRNTTKLLVALNK